MQVKTIAQEKSSTLSMINSLPGQLSHQTPKKQSAKPMDERLSKTDAPFRIENHQPGVHLARDFKYTGCNCRKSKCLKMYCTCFSMGKMCDKTCLCDNCKNSYDHEERSNTINDIISKDPFAFSRKNEIQHYLPFACKCEKSKCKKKYCDCFRNSRECNDKCRCCQCDNGKHVQKNNQQQSLLKEIGKQQMTEGKSRINYKYQQFQDNKDLGQEQSHKKIKLQ